MVKILSKLSDLSLVNYNPFGMVLVGRSWRPGSEYRYGFNGKEDDPETYGDGNIYDYGFRIYNPRLCKFLSIDPLFIEYPAMSPYSFALNTPILCIDYDGCKVKPMSKEALEAIKNSLSAEDAKKIQINLWGNIKKRPLKTQLKVSNSQNLNDLYTLVKDKRVVEVYTSSEGFESFKTADNSKQFEKFEAPQRFNPAEDSYNQNKDVLDKEGVTKEQYLKLLDEMGIKDEIEVNGNFGVTIHNKTDAINAGSYRYSTNKNSQIYINTNETTDREQAKNWAHEGYGHLLFEWLGKPSGHMGLPNGPTANKPLEEQIRDRTNEAEENFNDRIK